MRSIETEGAGGAERRRKLVALTQELIRAQVREALGIVEASRETHKSQPAIGERAIGMVEEFGGPPGAGAMRHACDLAGAEVDQEVELGLGVEEGLRDQRAVGGVFVHPEAGGFVFKETHGVVEDVDEVRLHRHDRAEAPEYPEEDLRQLVHAGQYDAGRRRR